MSRTVTVIPQKINPVTKMSFEAKSKRRVAGYARVSTDSEEQQTSYEAQVDYYTRYIRSNPEWEFVNVYTDEGISATNTKKREGFNQMIKDALDVALLNNDTVFIVPHHSPEPDFDALGAALGIGLICKKNKR